MSQEHVVTLDLVEVGYLHPPTYTHEEILQFIEDHDWSTTRQNGGVTSPGDNMHQIDACLDTELISLIQSPTFAVPLGEVQAVEVAATPFPPMTTYRDQHHQGQQHHLEHASPKDDTIRNWATESFKESALALSDTHTSPPYTPELRAAPIEGPRLRSPDLTATILVEVTQQPVRIPVPDEIRDMLPLPCVMHQGNAFGGHKRNIRAQEVTEDIMAADYPPTSARSESHLSVDKVHLEQAESGLSEDVIGNVRGRIASTAKSGPPLSDELSQSCHSSVVEEDNDIALSEEADLHTLVSPSDTIATSFVDALRDSGYAGRLFQTFDVPDKVEFGMVDEHSLPQPPDIAVTRSQVATNAGLNQNGTEIPLINPDGGFYPPATEAKNDEVQKIEPSAIVTDEVERYGNSSTDKQAIAGDGVAQPSDIVMDDEGARCSVIVSLAVLPRRDSPEDVLSTPDDVLSTPDEEASTRDALATASQPSGALVGCENPPSSQRPHMYDSLASDDCSEIHSSAGEDEHSNPPYAGVTESTATSNASTTTLIPFIMAALATYSPLASQTVDKPKRQFDCVEVETDANEEPAAKKQKKHSNCKPTDGDENEVEMNMAENGASNAVELDSSNTDCLDETIHSCGKIVSGTQVGAEIHVQVDTDSEVESTSIKEVSVAADSKPQIDSTAGSNAFAQDKKTQALYEQSPGDYSQPACPCTGQPPSFSGAYVQTADVEMQQRPTTASLSPIPKPSELRPTTSTAELRGVRIMPDPPLQQSAHVDQPAKVKSLGFKTRQDQMDTTSISPSISPSTSPSTSTSTSPSPCCAAPPSKLKPETKTKTKTNRSKTGKAVANSAPSAVGTNKGLTRGGFSTVGACEGAEVEALRGLTLRFGSAGLREGVVVGKKAWDLCGWEEGGKEGSIAGRTRSKDGE